MPYPTQIHYDALIETAHALIEAEGGAEKLSLKRLAEAVGVKAPSLYKHIENKDALVRAVNTLTEQRLYAAMGAALDAAPGDGLHAQLQAVAGAFRAFAHAHPVTYRLFFGTEVEAQRPPPVDAAGSILALQALMGRLSGEAESLPALRGLLALLHGFVTLELNGQFRRGGDLDAAFTQAVSAYLRGWSAGR